MRFNKIIFISLFLVFTLIGFAQVFGDGPKYDPVQWSGEVEKISDTEYILHYDAVIEKGWHMYSQFTPEYGPQPLRFEWMPEENKDYALNGKATESPVKKVYSDIFEVEEWYWKKKARISQPITLKNKEATLIKTILKHQTCVDVCINQEFYITHDIKNNKVSVFTDYNEFDAFKVAAVTTNDTDKGIAEEYNPEKKKGLWAIFLLAFGGGILALLTPCVFPMIPMTVGFFTKQSKTKIAGIRNALIYGVSIILIYVVLGLAVTAIFGADALNALSTSVAFNITFFILLVIFAVSFLGAFEIVLPNSWANKVDRQADRGGFIGIFFMALALAIVSFSCTGPIVGTTLVQAASKGGIAPAIGMLGFSTAIAIPFALFAMFPGWLNSLPKSGGWLNTVKVVLGFLELALAFKFLSNADLVLQTHFLERELFIAIIIAIMLGMSLYLLGKIKLPHDGEVPHSSVGRLCLALLTMTFVIYLVPGLWGAPLKLISGFPPPMNYSESPYGIGATKKGGSFVDVTIPEGAELGPHDIISFTEYDAGLAYAKKNNKPILIDFTGYACVNCRRMEERVWSESKILNVLKNDVVLISLYADAKEDLPKEEQYVSKTTGKRIKTIGNKWSDFQIERYQVNAQPYYVLMAHDETDLNTPVGYTPNVDTYEAWLKEGISRF